MRTLLVPFFDDAKAEAALSAACHVARRFSSHVEGLFVLRPPPVFEGEGIAMAGSYMTQFREEGRRLADGARQRFERFVAGEQISVKSLGQAEDTATAEWRELEGLEGPVISDHARLFDMMVIGREFGHPWFDWQVMCEAGLFESGRPGLVTPEQATGALGEKILVAWNGGTETARAISMSMPFLTQAKSVLVLTVEGATVPGPSGDSVAQHLKRNGIDAGSRTVGLGGLAAGEVIVNEAQAFGADMIVKGAYTNSRLRQLVFGGATRYLLGKASLPLLLAH
ncbi:MAG TPA: universal stress protein [Gammaproteobacteria bacterium]|nr:universal stress protein [Gammaproteobacteria bacterium]